MLKAWQQSRTVGSELNERLGRGLDLGCDMYRPAEIIADRLETKTALKKMKAVAQGTGSPR